MSFSGAGRVAVLILMTGPVVALESRPPGMTPVALTQTTPRVQTALLTISGTVIDGERRPVPGARVTAWSSGVRREAVSTASGGFQIDGLPAGTFRVMAALGQFMASDSVQVVLNDARGEPLRLALKPRYGGDEKALWTFRTACRRPTTRRRPAGAVARPRDTSSPWTWDVSARSAAGRCPSGSPKAGRRPPSS